MLQHPDLLHTQEEGQAEVTQAAVAVWVVAVEEGNALFQNKNRQGISPAGFYLNGSV